MALAVSAWPAIAAAQAFEAPPAVSTAARVQSAVAPVSPSTAARSGLSLEQAVAEGVQRNLDVLAARYNIPIAEADELTAGLWYNPTLSVDTVLQPFHKGAFDQGHTGGPAEYDLVVAYPVDLSRKLSKRKASARQATEAAKSAFQDAVRLKVLDIRRAYIDLMTAEEMLSLAREKEGNLRRLVELIQRRIGRSDLLPLLQTRARLAANQAALNVRQKESAVRVARTALALQLARPIDAPLETAIGLRDFKIVALPDRETFVRDAIERRPDMQALRFGRARAVADIALNRAMAWDNTLLGLGVSRQNGLASDPQVPGSHFLAGANSWSASLGIPLPLFNRNQGGVRHAELAVEQIDKQIASLEHSIRQEVAAAYDEADVSVDIIHQYETEDLRNAQLVRDAQQRLFGTGANALLDYFDAMSAYNDALGNYYSTVADYRRAIAQLNASAGRDVLP